MSSCSFVIQHHNLFVIKGLPQKMSKGGSFVLQAYTRPI